MAGFPASHQWITRIVAECGFSLKPNRSRATLRFTMYGSQNTLSVYLLSTICTCSYIDNNQISSNKLHVHTVSQCTVNRGRENLRQITASVLRQFGRRTLHGRLDRSLTSKCQTGSAWLEARPSRLFSSSTPTPVTSLKYGSMSSGLKSLYSASIYAAGSHRDNN